MKKTSLNKDKINFLFLEGIHNSAIKSLNSAGYFNIENISTALDQETLKEKIANVHFLGIRSRTQVTEEILNSASKLNAIGCFCIGTNQVDLISAKEHGVVVFNAPFSNTRSVAELVLAQAILLLRKIPEKNFASHKGIWLKSAESSYEARGKTLGIIGYGSIGSQLSVLAEGLGMKVIFYDIIKKLPLGNAKSTDSLKDLLINSDVVTLHVPELSSTKNMISKEELALMKKGSILINAARGNVVVIEDLVEILKTKHLGGVAIDVFPKEPKSNNEEFISPLREFENAILTPHIGGSTMEAQANIGTEVAEKLILYSDNGTTTSAVNFPEVALPAQDKNRILHIHKNVPGVMSSINNIFAENNINISSEYLRSDDKIGYVVIDIDSQSSELVVKKLSDIPATIRCRVLF